MHIISRILILMTSRQVGVDNYGNRYYEGRKKNRLGKFKRFVIYHGQAEATKVAAQWHGWLHYTDTSTPPAEDRHRQPWQKDHLPNLTGTIYAHRPSGHLLAAGTRPPATGDYEAWKPQAQNLE